VATPWAEKVGDVLTRQQRKDKYGGSTMGGIEPSSTSDNVFIYSDPSKGARHGYNFDGWDPDAEIFLYTGDGRKGNQTLTGGNKSIYEHRQNGKALRVFIADGVVPGTQTKTHVYIGEFELDAEQPFTRERSAGDDDLDREVYVWRLRPVSADYLRRDRDVSALAEADPAETQTETVPLDSHLGESVNVELEQSSGDSYAVSAAEDRIADKREKRLVDRFAAFLVRGGHEVARRRITPAGHLVSLYTDIYDVTVGELFEAKGTTRREDVRMAIGQLFDYRRHMPAGTLLTILLPGRPSNDVLHLIGSVGFGCIYESDGRFERVLPPVTRAEFG
jgi:hypothetical protein